MECCIDEDFEKRTGLNAAALKKGGFVEYEDDTNTVNFYPSKKRGENYLKWASGFQQKLSINEIIQTVKEYTNHLTWYCSTVNLLLAAESSDIEHHADFIKKLKYSVRNLSSQFPVKEKVCYRGLTCSKKEINHYNLGSTIYIPSFLSTSRNLNKFYCSNNKNTLMAIRLNIPHPLLSP